MIWNASTAITKEIIRLGLNLKSITIPLRRNWMPIKSITDFWINDVTSSYIYPLDFGFEVVNTNIHCACEENPLMHHLGLSNT
jgi:hypothetical protein